MFSIGGKADDGADMIENLLRLSSTDHRHLAKGAERTLVALIQVVIDEFAVGREDRTTQVAVRNGRDNLAITSSRNLSDVDAYRALFRNSISHIFSVRRDRDLPE